MRAADSSVRPLPPAGSGASGEAEEKEKEKSSFSFSSKKEKNPDKKQKLFFAFPQLPLSSARVFSSFLLDKERDTPPQLSSKTPVSYSSIVLFHTCLENKLPFFSFLSFLSSNQKQVPKKKKSSKKQNRQKKNQKTRDNAIIFQPLFRNSSSRSVEYLNVFIKKSSNAPRQVLRARANVVKRKTKKKKKKKYRNTHRTKKKKKKKLKSQGATAA